MKLTGENRSTRGKKCPSATLSTTNPTRTYLFFFNLFLWSIFCLQVLPSFMSLIFRTTVLIQQTQHRHPCPRRDFFCACPGFFPFDPFLYCLNPFRPSCHFTFHITVLTTNTTQTSMPSAGFEPTIPVSGRPQTYALDHAATGIGFGIEPGPPRWETGV